MKCGRESQGRDDEFADGAAASGERKQRIDQAQTVERYGDSQPEMRHKRAESLIIQVDVRLFGRRNADTIGRNRRRYMRILLPFLLVTLCLAQKRPPIQLDASMPRQQQIDLAESAAPKS